MKTRLYAALMLLGFLLLTACGGGDGDAPNTYKVGDTGPAGGIVFYITPDSGGLHGLEAAPNDLPASPWGCLGTNIMDTSADIGTGNDNTNKILLGCNDVDTAADRATKYVSETGHDDWYLPSMDELGLFVNYIVTTYVENRATFMNMWWSSTQHITLVDRAGVYIDNVNTGGTIDVNASAGTKTELFLVRPTRTF